MFFISILSLLFAVHHLQISPLITINHWLQFPRGATVPIASTRIKYDATRSKCLSFEDEGKVWESFEDEGKVWKSL
jgi:hypothetical protein